MELNVSKEITCYDKITYSPLTNILSKHYIKCCKQQIMKNC